MEELLRVLSRLHGVHFRQVQAEPRFELLLGAGQERLFVAGK